VQGERGKQLKHVLVEASDCYVVAWHRLNVVERGVLIVITALGKVKEIKSREIFVQLDSACGSSVWSIGWQSTSFTSRHAIDLYLIINDCGR